MKYFREKIIDDVTYSIDMLRLELEFGTRDEEFVRWVEHLDAFSDFDIVYQSCFSPFKYRHLWTFKLEDGISFVIGLNIAKTADKGFIEFNPNKCAIDSRFMSFYDKLMTFVISASIVRYDFAIDIPTNRDNCMMIKDHRNYQIIVDKSKTEYLGVRNKVGFVKLYDKTVESNLDYSLTRLEITCKPGEVPNVPQIRIKLQQSEFPLSNSLSSTDLVLYELCQRVENPYLYIRKLDKKKYKKIKDLLECDQKAFEIDQHVNAYLLSDVGKIFVK